jgi:2-keto-4-pentenoate hydratase
MPITDVPGKARALYDARRDRTPIPPFTDTDATLGMADGYAVQRALVDLIRATATRSSVTRWA